MKLSLQQIHQLILFRWFLFVGLIIAALATKLFAPDLQFHHNSLWMLICYALSNVVLFVAAKHIPHKLSTPALTFVLILDTLILTEILKLNGSYHNPFSILFLAIASVGTLLLSPPGIILLIVSCLTGLWIVYSQISMPDMHHQHHGMNDYPFHLQGMWLANSLSVILTSGWIYYLRRMNEKTSEQHRNTQRILSNIERLDSVGRIAAQAAHQINTPLGTLQLGLSEMTDEAHPMSQEDTRRWIGDMQHAVKQISTAVSQLLPNQTSSSSDDQQSNDVFHFIEEWTLHWEKPRQIKIDLQFSGEPLKSNENFIHDIGTVLAALLDNALEAVLGKQPKIMVSVRHEAGIFTLKISDNGLGMSSDVAARAIDPLFTTKKTGTGLGLYVCHQIARKYSGDLEIVSKQNTGTSVIFSTRNPRTAT